MWTWFNVIIWWDCYCDILITFIYVLSTTTVKKSMYNSKTVHSSRDYSGIQTMHQWIVKQRSGYSKEHLKSKAISHIRWLCIVWMHSGPSQHVSTNMHCVNVGDALLLGFRTTEILMQWVYNIHRLIFQWINSHRRWMHAYKHTHTRLLEEWEN